MNKLKILLFLPLLIFSTAATAQIVHFTETFGSPNIERVTGLQVGAQDAVFLCGTFGANLTIGAVTLPNSGIEDIFLAKIGADGNTDWAVRAGGADRDEVSGLQLSGDTAIFVAGRFWDAATFGGTSLVKNGSHLFVARYDTSGQLRWVRPIFGTSGQSVEVGALDAAGQYYVAGQFSDSLFFENDTLVTAAINDGFVAKFDAAGNCLWARQIGGFEEQTKVTGLTVTATGEVFAAGEFNGRIEAAGEILWAASLDFDIFFAKYDANGGLLWNKRIGGIFDDMNPKLGLSANNSVVMAGNLIGLLNFDAANSLQTGQFDRDIFLATFDIDGQVLTKKQFGASQSETLLNLVVNGNECYLLGYFNTFTTIGTQAFSTASANLQNLFFRIDLTQINAEPAVWSYGGTLPSATAVAAPYTLASNADVVFAGTFQGEIQLPDAPVLAAGFTDIFMVRTSFFPVPTTPLPYLQPQILLFPNPTNDFLTVVCEGFLPDFIQIFDTNGRLCHHLDWSCKGEARCIFDIRHLPKGNYFLKINKKTTQILIKN